MFGGYYRGRNVLVTGHSGFKGGWLSLWLKHLGATVYGMGLGPPTDPNLYETIHKTAFERETTCDIRARGQVQAAVAQVAPDLIFHLAAQPLVRESYQSPAETFEVNTLGTVNVLEAVRALEIPCTVVVVTSDKCYQNQGWDYGYRETDPLGGNDVYSASKAAAELVVHAWRKSFFCSNPKLGRVATARGGNVIGGGDYARDRIVPDCVRALMGQQPIVVRNPGATRPWQHVLDCLSGYLWLGACLGRGECDPAEGSAFNFGPGLQANLPVAALVQEILKIWPGRWERATPPGGQVLPEAEKLNLAIDKAAAKLGWLPAWGLPEAVRETIGWYHQRHALKRVEMVDFSVAQIESYAAAARTRNLRWACEP